MSALTGYKQYMRKYRVIVRSKKGGDIDTSNLRCIFHVEKTLDDTPGYSQLSIYNLKQSTVRSIAPGDSISIEAGYEKGNYGMIFTGDVVQPLTSLEEGVDYVLTLICQDGDQFLTSAFVMQTLEKKTPFSAIVGACTKGVTTNLITDEIEKKGKLIRGKVLFGRAAGYVKKLADSVQSQLFVEDGKVNIVGAKDYDSGTAVVLNSDTGLIGTPNQTDDGVSYTCLINPSIKLNSLVNIDANQVAQKKISSGETAFQEVNADGIYRVVKITYDGDTHGNDWYMKCEAITQSGAKPDGLVNGETNPWR